MAFDGRNNIIDMNEDEHYIEFDTWSPKKITGHRISGILGASRFKTPFAVACEIAGFGYDEPSNKYIVAGNVIEPIMREYVRKNLSSIPDLGIDGVLGVDEPAPPERCGYDHFHAEKLFGGLVDGYVTQNGKRVAVLEIKTMNRNRWEVEEERKVPLEYIMQAGLYTRLSGMGRMVFAIALLDEEDYRVPDKWSPSEDNIVFVCMDVPDEMDRWMSECKGWYDEYIRAGYTPDWDEEKDADLLKYLRAGVRKRNNKKK